ncbi:hypothetical protein [Lachnotalea sp. AF33-28]|uniref:hypothetical protein n=1 Tax=Lachnotalea sp. AF33-28 TaxID=2292046 RepID=UPI000E553C9C|nr:hypothetical protein [Lachnotalea sp. AF33-28]RHP32307.1 hypothetical protein DWZ56_13375 [Lachnotalea sp. AF33-28]
MNHLDNLCAKIDILIEKEKSSIDKLHDMKETLISNVVKGKFDVRGFDIPDYEYIKEETDMEDDSESEDEITEEE